MCKCNVKWKRHDYLTYCSTKCRSSDPEVKEKWIESINKKFGCDHHFKNKEVQNSIRETCFNKYGVDWHTKREDAKLNLKLKIEESDRGFGSDKFYEGMINNHGFMHALQNDDLHKKQIKKSKSWKQYKLPSGKIVDVQGFENKALDILLKIYNEDDIIIERISDYTGIIRYEYQGEIRIYKPDLYIKSIKKIIEVKSDYIMLIQFDKNMAKRDACIKLGFDFEFMIL
jgi:hypothetical protein